MRFHYKTILFTLRDGIGHIEMNQPPSNRMTIRFFSELGKLAAEIRQMESLKALVISGTGRHFSAGADLTELLSLVRKDASESGNRSDKELAAFLKNNYKTFLIVNSLEIPVISAIRGACLGSAVELALFTHFRFCGEDAVFGLPESTFNLIPGIGGISGLSALTGKGRALEIVLRGNTFGAEDALNYNLVDRIFPKKKVVEKALEFAATIPAHYKKEKAKMYLSAL
jgi:enoyl-CoA hydratase/carnithine racemase